MPARQLPPASDQVVFEPLEPRVLLSAAVTTVTVLEKAGIATPNYPLTLSVIFRAGDVASTVTARVDGQAVPTQTDVKATHDDGSVKHALVSLVVPQMPAGGQVAVEILDGGANANADWVTPAELLATDFEALLSLDVGGTPYDVSARSMLAGLAEAEYWIQGEVCSEILIRDFDANVEDQLNVQFYVRTYPGWAGFRVDTVVENCWTQYRGNLDYDFALTLGAGSPVTVLEQTGFTHNYNARWHEVCWQGAELPEIEVHYDLDYMISTGLLPRYDSSLAVPESTVAGAYASWQASSHDLMERGIVTAYFPTTGGRQEIGLYPTWAARYLLSMDNRMREITLNCGDVSGYIPIHLRESDPARANYQAVMSIDDRPTVWAGRWDYAWTDPADRLPAPIGPTETIWTVDMAHQASFATIPYIATGDYYYYEEMAFWAAWDLADVWITPRQNDRGIIHEQTRGEAWAVRNVADAANLAPPDHAGDAVYFNDKIANTLAQWESDYLGNPAAFPAIHYWHRQSNLGADGGRPDAALDPTVRYYTSCWQDDFVLIALGHLADIGYDSADLVDWLGESIIDRFHHADVNWFRGAPYHTPSHYNDGADGGVPYATWDEIDDAFVAQPGPTDFADPDYPFSYNAIARAALGCVAGLPYGQVTWEWLDGQVHFKDRLAEDPTWAFLPPSDEGDVTPPAAVTDLAVGAVGDGSVELLWTAVGDDGLDGAAMAYDVRYAAEPITDANWDSATQADGEPFPQLAGSPESMVVAPLQTDTHYHFALKVLDNRYNESGLSNGAAATTLLDAVAPADVTDLAVTDAAGTKLTLSWTAPGDDGGEGTAHGYDLRYATETITEANWASATPVEGEPVPSPAGSAEQMTVAGLEYGTRYYFALKTTDNGGNVSGLSNVAAGKTANRPGGAIVDFETAGDEAQFVQIAGTGSLSRQAGHDGHVLDFDTGNFGNASAVYRPAGEAELLMGYGAIHADFHVRYYDSANYGPNAGHQGLLVKVFDDGAGGWDAYSAVVFYNGGDLWLRIGCSGNASGNGDWLAGPGHTGYVQALVKDIPAVGDNQHHDLGWWHISARLRETQPGEIQIRVTVTEDDGATTHELTYTDSGPARYMGEGRIGVMTGEIWSTHAQYDNFWYAHRRLGDANGDGLVNWQDLGVLATNYNATGMNWANADFTGDGTVNWLDLGILATLYNHSEWSPEGSGLGGAPRADLAGPADADPVALPAPASDSIVRPATPARAAPTGDAAVPAVRLYLPPSAPGQEDGPALPAPAAPRSRDLHADPADVQDDLLDLLDPVAPPPL